MSPVHVTRYLAPLDRRTWVAAAYLVATTLVTLFAALLAAITLAPWLAVTLVALLGVRLGTLAKPMDTQRARWSGHRTEPGGDGPIQRRLALSRARTRQAATWWAPVLAAGRASASADRRMASTVLHRSTTNPVAGSASRDTTRMALLLPLTTLCATITLVVGILVTVLLTTPLWAGPHEQLAFGALGTYPVGSPTRRAVAVLGGLGLALLTTPLLRWIGERRARLAWTLLVVDDADTTIANMAERMHAMREEHNAAVRVNVADHRRIERDLHDGTQARLTALILDLGRARRKLDSDPSTAHTLVEDAYQQAQQALAEIRQIARGIQPPILADRGLDAAISALTAYGTVPLHVDVRVTQRLPAAIESAAYFIAAEALTNTTKHARAKHASVFVDYTDDRCVIEVCDDGDGGATASPNGGLAGLADRALALGGFLTVNSPPGGPTIIRAELPCAS